MSNRAVIGSIAAASPRPATVKLAECLLMQPGVIGTRHELRSKKPAVLVAAVARELCGFVWAIGQEVKPMVS
jgi:hypothetical protein